MEIVALIIILLAAYLLAQWGVMWMTKRACMRVIKDLDAKGAYTPGSAVVLPYAQKKGMFHVGMRDYRPQAIQFLVHKEVVHTTDEGRFYLASNIQNLKDVQL